MKFLTLALLAVFSFAATLAKIETEDAVLVLTKDNFEEAISQNDYVLVEFYAPWCVHCKALAPEYVKAAKKLLELGSAVKLAKVDAIIEKELAEQHNVQGYPTLKFFRKGVPISYSGSRVAAEIVSWVTKKAGPAVKDLKTVEEAKALIDAQDTVIVGFFKDVESNDAKVFLEVGNTIDDYEFGITSNEEVFNEYKTEDGKIILFKKFDEGRSEFSGELNVNSLENFIFVHSLPVVVDFDHETARKIFNGHIKSHLLVFLSKEAGHYDEYIEKIKEPATKLRDKVLFVTINTDEVDHERILEFFGTKGEIPSMRILNLEQNMAKFKPEKPDLSSENILEFVTDFLDGKLKTHLLTETLPEDWDAKPVKVLVATNFHEVAHDKEKNVLVEFYAPWCGHCNSLAPIYEQLGEKYKDQKDLVIAKIDATANELEDIKIKNYPTIILYKKETNEAVEYTAERTLQGLSKFIDTDGTYGQAAEEAQEEDENDDAPRKDEL